MPSVDISRFQLKPKAEQPKEVQSNSLRDFFHYDISFSSKTLSDKKKEYLYLELSSLLQAGVDLKSGFDLITAGGRNRKELILFKRVQEMIISGKSFSQAMNETGYFSLYEVYSLQIGEETGKIIEVLKDLADYYKNRIKQRRKIVAALTYPAVVLSTSIGAVIFMLKFVVPMFGDVFHRFGGELPWVTARILSLSGWIENKLWFFFLLICGAFTLLFSLRNTLHFRKTISLLLLQTPVVGNLIQKIYLVRFCNSMRLLISSHLPLLRAISLTRRMIAYYPIETSLQAIETDILQGKSLNESLRRFKIYPPKMVLLIKVGEETNQLDYFFGKISEQYLEEIEYKTSTISSLMEPLIIITLGIIVGLILIAMYLPLFQMSNTLY